MLNYSEKSKMVGTISLHKLPKTSTYLKICCNYFRRWYDYFHYLIICFLIMELNHLIFCFKCTKCQTTVKKMLIVHLRIWKCKWHSCQGIKSMISWSLQIQMWAVISRIKLNQIMDTESASLDITRIKWKVHFFVVLVNWVFNISSVRNTCKPDCCVSFVRPTAAFLQLCHVFHVW